MTWFGIGQTVSKQINPFKTVMPSIKHYAPLSLTVDWHLHSLQWAIPTISNEGAHSGVQCDQEARRTSYWFNCSYHMHHSVRRGKHLWTLGIKWNFLVTEMYRTPHISCTFWVPGNLHVSATYPVCRMGLSSDTISCTHRNSIFWVHFMAYAVNAMCPVHFMLHWNTIARPVNLLKLLCSRALAIFNFNIHMQSKSAY